MTLKQTRSHTHKQVCGGRAMSALSGRFVKELIFVLCVYAGLEFSYAVV